MDGSFHGIQRMDWEMNQEKPWRELRSLPLEAQREVLDFIAFLRKRYKMRHPSDKPKSSLLDEPFIGMWRDREDMEDHRDVPRLFNDQQKPA